MTILLSHIQILSAISLDVSSVLMVIVIGIAFVITWAVNRISLLRIRQGVNKIKETSAIMQHTLDMGKNYVVMLDLRQRHGINIHGNLLPDSGMSYEESFEMIHPDDRHIYMEFIKRLANGEKETDECIFRWDMSGEKRLGQWRYMEDQGIAEYANAAGIRPIHIFSTLTDRTEQILLEKEEQEMVNKYRRIFEQSLTGLAFYDKDGRLLTTNQKMREILKFQSERDPYYYERSLFDMPTFRELLNKRHVEELYFCTKSIIIERGVNCYTEMRVHPIYKDDGELYSITFSIRDVTQERELYLQNKKNSHDIRVANEAIQQYENEIQYLMDTCNMRFFRCSRAERTCTFYKGMTTDVNTMGFDKLIEHFVDSPFRQGLVDYDTYFSVQRTELTKMHPLFHEGEEMQWNFIDSVPFFDENGEMLGTYGIVRNVNDLIEKQERLKQETERANDSGRLKSVFMANMTHEIRTPLNSIVGFSDVLPMLSTQEEKQEIIRVIMNNCDMLMRLINDILAISSLDTGGISIETVEVDFAKSFDDICESLKQRVQEPSVEFIKENPYDSFVTVLDDARIQQVITNFVTNAVKYTHEGHIKVGYRYEESGVRSQESGDLYIYCEDTGAGIPKEHQAKIFERFVKLNDFIQGTGLGLSICKAVADACHGEIGVESEGEGKGSTFWIRIPCEKK
jgi:signal transduction histidine kinase